MCILVYMAYVYAYGIFGGVKSFHLENDIVFHKIKPLNY